MKHKIEIQYDGKYPCLCMGHLIIFVDGVKYDFDSFRLISGGTTGFTKDGDEFVEEGLWDVDFPDNFPDEFKDDVIREINLKIPHGCCGGCL